MSFRVWLEDLGVSITRETRRELEMSCPFHEDDNPSFYVNKETGAWFCHAGCGGGSFFELERKLSSLVIEVSQVPPSTLQELSQVVRSLTGLTPVRVELQFLLDRGFTTEMLERWGIHYNEDIGATAIPCYRSPDDFVGYIFRMPDGIKPKYRHPSGFPRAEILFGIDKLALDAQEIHLAEGPLDAIWLSEAGLPAVATLGTRLSPGQLELICKRRLKAVTLVYDNDEPGRMAEALAVQMLRKVGIFTWRREVPKCYKDVQEVPFSDVARLPRHVVANGSGLLAPHLRRWFDSESQNQNASSPWRYT